MKRYDILFVILLIVASCGKNTPPEINPIIINANNTERICNGGCILDTSECELIALGMTNNPIGIVSKMQIVDNYIFILDSHTKSLHVFYPNGDVKLSIQRIGNSSNEYLDITDFFATSTNIYILDQDKMKIMVFDFNGNFEKNINISDYWANSIYVKNESIFLSNNNSDTKYGKYRIFEIDINGNLINKYLPFQKRYRFSSDRSFSVMTRTSNTLFCNAPINYIYNVTEEGVNPTYLIDFGKNNLLKEYSYMSMRDFFAQGLYSKYVYGIDEIYHTAKYIFIKYNFNKDTYTAVYNKSNKRVEMNYQNLIITDLYHIGLSNYYIQDGYIYDINSADNFITLYFEILKNRDIKEKYKTEIQSIIKNINEESNPIIVKYKIQDE